MRTRKPWLVVSAIALTSGAVEARDQEYAVHIAHAATADTVRRVLQGAAQRLDRPRCQAVLDGFKDAQGRPLRTTLDAAGVSGAVYLSLLVFYDGTRKPQCESGRVLAATTVGGRIVWICPEAFRKAARRDPGIAEMILIHEALHSLGLGENPPSSAEITSRVWAACRR
jgi:hypothetical protein